MAASGVSAFGQATDDSVRYRMPAVTVTTTRSQESYIESPLAIRVLEQGDLSLTKGYGLDEALSGVPGVFVQSRYGNQDVRLTIRGFGARGAGERSNAGTSRGVLVLVDGIPETEPDGRTSFDLVDLSAAGRIEVIRSNASSLWGNASGGVLNISSNTMFDAPYVSIGSSFGSHGFRKQLLQVGTMIGEGRFYLSLNNTTSDGWREHSRSAQTVLKAGVVTRLGEETDLAIHFSGTSNFFQIPGPLTQAQFDADPKQAQRDSMQTPGFGLLPSFVQRDERRLNRLGRIGSTLSHAFDESNSISAMIFAAPKFLQRSERNTFRDFTRYHLGGNMVYRNTSVFSENIRNTFTIGLDEAYQDGAVLFHNLSQGERGTTLRDNKREGANTFGVFAQEELTLNNQLGLSIGGRYDNVTYYSDSYITPKLNDKRSFERVTPKVGISYRISPMHSVYANIGGGIEVPAGNETDPAGTYGQDTVTSLNPLLDAIRSTTYEVGMKHLIGSSDGNSPFRHVSYDIALYHITVNNDIIPYAGGRFYFTAGETRRTGVELGLTSAFSGGLTIQSSLTYSNNRFSEYTIDSVHYGNAGHTANLKDNKLPGVPEIFYLVGLRFSPDAYRYGFIEVRAHGNGSYFADDYNQVPVPSYTVFNAMIGLKEIPLSSEQLVLNLQVGVNNFTDQRHAASVFINPDYSNGTPAFLEPGLPRNVVGSLSLGWRY